MPNCKHLIFTFCFLFSGAAISQQTLTFNTVHEGLDRNYALYVPASYEGLEATPLVFNLHGFGSNAAEEQFYTGMQFVADREGFLLCFPNGLENSWNVGWNFGSSADDVGFIDQILTEISGEYNVNSQKVYSCGMSNGGFMSYTLACELNDKIAAVASVTGAMAESYVPNCVPNRAVPVMQIHGTADNVVFYEGTEDVNIPIEAVVQFWVNNNGCNTRADTIVVDNTDTTDGSTAVRIEYNQCSADESVVFYKIEGGGHTWPGASLTIGVTNRDFNASQEIWNFFDSFENSFLADTEDQQISQSLFISPNPTHDFINIKLDQIEEYKIFNLQGETLLSGKNNSIINVQDLNTGLYFIKASSAKGEHYISKFVKQ